MSRRHFPDDVIRRIRNLAKPCPCCGEKRSYASIAKEFDVSAVAVYHIVAGHTYKDVE